MVEVRERSCGKELVDNRMKRGPGYSAGVTSSSSANRITANTRVLRESVSFLPLGEVASSQFYCSHRKRYTFPNLSRSGGSDLRLLLFSF